MFKIEFETLNSGIQSPEEIARILKHIGQKVTNYETEGRIRDNNGNTIGQWSWAVSAGEKLDKNQEHLINQLAIVLANDYSFYSSLRSVFEYHASRMFEGNYNKERLEFDIYREVIKACLSPLVKRHVGPTSAREKKACANILADKYEEEILSIFEGMESESHA